MKLANPNSEAPTTPRHKYLLLYCYLLFFLGFLSVSNISIKCGGRNLTCGKHDWVSKPLQAAYIWVCDSIKHLLKTEYPDRKTRKPSRIGLKKWVKNQVDYKVNKSIKKTLTFKVPHFVKIVFPRMSNSLES